MCPPFLSVEFSVSFEKIDRINETESCERLSVSPVQPGLYILPSLVVLNVPAMYYAVSIAGNWFLLYALFFLRVIL